MIYGAKGKHFLTYVDQKEKLIYSQEKQIECMEFLQWLVKAFIRLSLLV